MPKLSANRIRAGWIVGLKRGSSGAGELEAML
jgi:hypothetical protein